MAEIGRHRRALLGRPAAPRHPAARRPARLAPAGAQLPRAAASRSASTATSPACVAACADRPETWINGQIRAALPRAPPASATPIRSRSGIDGRARRRPLRRGARRGLLRREHVQPPPRRLEVRADRAGGAAARRRLPPARHPVRHRPPGAPRRGRDQPRRLPPPARRRRSRGRRASSRCPPRPTVSRCCSSPPRRRSAGGRAPTAPATRRTSSRRSAARSRGCRGSAGRHRRRRAGSPRGTRQASAVISRWPKRMVSPTRTSMSCGGAVQRVEPAQVQPSRPPRPSSLAVARSHLRAAWACAASTAPRGRAAQRRSADAASAPIICRSRTSSAG